MSVYVQVMSEDVGSSLPEAATLSFHEALQVCNRRTDRQTEALLLQHNAVVSALALINV